MISREEVREKLTGPIASLTTPFTRDGEIDYPGLRKLIDGNLEGGSNSSLLTYGDSLFSLMTDDEIAEVTRVVSEHTGKRGSPSPPTEAGGPARPSSSRATAGR